MVTLIGKGFRGTVVALHSRHTKTDDELADALWRSCELKGGHVRLAGIVSAPSGLARAFEALADPLLNEIIECISWHEAYSGRYRSDVHVEPAELEEVFRELRVTCIISLRSERIANVVDSRMVLGAWAKGCSTKADDESACSRVRVFASCKPVKVSRRGDQAYGCKAFRVAFRCDGS